MLVTASIKSSFGRLSPAYVASIHKKVLCRMRIGLRSQSRYTRLSLRLSAMYLLTQAVMLTQNNSLSQAHFLLVNIKAAPVSCSFRLARRSSQQPADIAVLQIVV